MISLSASWRFLMRPLCVPALLLGVLAFSATALTSSRLPAQATAKQEDRHTKLLARDLAQLKDLVKDKLVTVEVSGGKQKSYLGRIVGIREILGEQFLQLAAPEE